MSTGPAMPEGDPAALEQYAAELDRHAADMDGHSSRTAQVTASIRDNAEWTGAAADGYTAYTSNQPRGQHHDRNVPMTEPDQGQSTAILYAEKRSAMRWPYYFHLVLWACVLAAGVPLLMLNPSLSIVAAIGTMGLITVVVIIGVNFRTGIEITTDGIRIGAVSHVRRSQRNLPWGDAQRKEVFFCPWSAVHRAAVVTDRATLKDAGRLRNPPVKLGVLWSPFAKAAMLIEVGPEDAVFPKFREPDQRRPFFRAYHPGPFRPSPIWYAPTKQPGELRQVLARHVTHAGYDSSLNTHPYLFEREDVTLPR